MPPELNYWDWVEIIGSHNFSEVNLGRQVRLTFPEDQNWDEFLKVVRSWNIRSSLSETEVVVKLCKAWNPETGVLSPTIGISACPPADKTNFPPYLPYLLVFSLAWNEEPVEGLSPSNYYRRLRGVLHPSSESNKIGSSEFAEITRTKVWERLSEWANNVKSESLGTFTVTSFGRHRHIGYPLSQVILTPRARKVLRDLFSKENYSGSHCLEKYEIDNLLKKYLDRFDARIKTAIKTGAEQLLEPLRAEVALELESYEPREEDSDDENQILRYKLKYAFNFNSENQIINWRFVFDDAEEVENVPAMTGADSFRLNPGSEYGLVTQKSGEERYISDPIEFFDFNPLEDEILFEKDGHKVVAPKRIVRIFIHSQEDAWIESDFFPERQPFMLLTESDSEIGGELRSTFEKNQWLEDNLWKGFQIVVFKYSFSMTDAEKLNFQEQINKLKNMEALRIRFRHSDNQPIQFVEGIRYESGIDGFFPFGIPKIKVAEGWSIDTSCVELSGPDENQMYELPSEAVLGEIELLAKLQGRRDKKRTLHVDQSPSISDEYCRFRYLEDEFERRCFSDIPNASSQSTRLSCQQLFEQPLRSVDLWQTLSTWGRCTWSPRCKNAIEFLFPPEECRRKAWQIIEAWRKLGHVCIESGKDAGQWNKICITQGRLRQLPWNITIDGDEYYQALFEGQINLPALRNRLLRTLRFLESPPDSIKVDVQFPERKYLPPRIKLMALHQDSLRNCAEHLQLRWVENLILFDAPISVAEYEETVRQTPSVITNLSSHPNMKSFSSFQLKDEILREEQLQRLVEISSKYILNTHLDSYFSRPPEFNLYDKEDGKRYTLNRSDRQIARWLCYQKNHKRLCETIKFSNNINMPYDKSTGSLFIPKSLTPPYVLDALLISCSGESPKYLSTVEHIFPCKLNKEFVLNPDSSVNFLFPKGTVFSQYIKVPPEIAAYVCDKLACDKFSLQ